MKHWCGKGLLARDRERGRCGRCGLSTTLPPPSHMTKHERKLLKAGKGPAMPDSVKELLKDRVCNECNHGRHKVCQDHVMWFCHCWRSQHTLPIVEEVIESEEEFEDFF